MTLLQPAVDIFIHHSMGDANEILGRKDLQVHSPCWQAVLEISDWVDELVVSQQYVILFGLERFFFPVLLGLPLGFIYDVVAH